MCKQHRQQHVTGQGVTPGRQQGRGGKCRRQAKGVAGNSQIWRTGEARDGAAKEDSTERHKLSGMGTPHVSHAGLPLASGR